ncbi:type IV conjugative transfer system coupling protein TraD [Pseudomonas sp. P5_152]|uniref:type IV conjugative transfer system coupling protein TraD n=1 Tax=Pseudomonas sp. P5_152 TaxID=3043442 RepID=UPI002A36B4CB|nr:type IV conjugative transfer system coupling protein TraD [Pseudomonas sp. P5_152]MDX9668635.1 type IV conjugative transfer system coupling protein TraD [Pseudomonas sp. P5_152]
MKFERDSFSAKNVTQGGQVTAYMIRMFVQINNMIAYYLLLLWVLLILVWVFVRNTYQQLHHGVLYWYVDSLSSLYELTNSEQLYSISFTDAKGVVYTAKLTGTKLLNDPYFISMGSMLRRELMLGLVAGGAVVVALGCYAFWWLGNRGREQSEDEVLGGRTLAASPKDVAKLMKAKDDASTIKIGDLPMKKNGEIQNFAFHGTVGTGKTTALNLFLEQIRARGERVIIYDKGTTFIEKFYDASRDKVLNPVDVRCANWDLWEECRSLADFDNVANTLIPMGSNDDPFWQGSARTIFAAVANQMGKDPERSINKLLRTLLAIDLPALRTYLAGTEAASLVDEKIEKTAISIRSVLTNYVKSMRYLQGLEASGKPKFAIRDWMHNESPENNGWLFVTSNGALHTSLKPVISMWLYVAATTLLSMQENRHRRIWFLLDELPSLHKLPGLPEILAEARKFGGCFLLGFQSNPQLQDIWGPKSAAAMVDLLNTRFFFRSPSAEVAEFVAKELGETRLKRFSDQYSYGLESVRDGVTFNKRQENERIVSYSDIQNLPDLHCYVTLPGGYPVTQLELKRKEYKSVAEPFLERSVNELLDPLVEETLRDREAPPEAKQLMAAIGVAGVVVAETLVPSPYPLPNSVVPASAIAESHAAASTTSTASSAATAAATAATAATADASDGNQVEFPAPENVDFIQVGEHKVESHTGEVIVDEFDRFMSEETNINWSAPEPNWMPDVYDMSDMPDRGER